MLSLIINISATTSPMREVLQMESILIYWEPLETRWSKVLSSLPIEVGMCFQLWVA